MHKVKKEEMYKIVPFFEGWNETPIWSCFQGYMGNAWADNNENPKSAQVIAGDLCFFAGVPDIDLVKNIPLSFPSKCILMVPQNEGWAILIEQVYKNSCNRFMRYSIKKETGIFDREKLRTYIEKLPTEYNIMKIDEELFNKVKKEEWSKDLCSQFPTYMGYEEYGLGFVVLLNGMIVSGASSYTVYDKGIEIEIDTKDDYRRKGLALACASRLILECLDRGLYPSWDATDMNSVALAEKLGYHLEKEYVTYSVSV